MTITLGELAERISAGIEGDATCEISGVATLKNASSDDISFFTSLRYRSELENTSAAAVILARQHLELCPVNALVIDNPYLGYARVAAVLHPQPLYRPGIDPTAIFGEGCVIHDSTSIGACCVIGEGVRIGEDVFIGSGSYIGNDVTIGAGSRLTANVTICQGTQIGMRALIHPGVVIGSDGFGLANDQGVWVKVPQLGGVCIGDDVEIGANTTIDCGTIDDTVLEDGVKIDNQVQIAHNVYIGAHTAIAGCTGVAGSVRIGKRCAIGGGVGIAGHLEIADDVTITVMSLVTRSIREPGIYSSGVPLQENKSWRRNFARFKQLDEIARRLQHIEARLEVKQKKDN